MIKMGQIASERVKTQTWELVNESIRIEKFLNGSEHTCHLQNAPSESKFANATSTNWGALQKSDIRSVINTPERL